MNGQHKILCLIKRPRHSELEFVGGISIYQYNTLGMFVRYPKIKNFFLIIHFHYVSKIGSIAFEKD